MPILDRLDPRTPLVIGVGHASERIDDPDYAGLSPVELATAAARAAIDVTGADILAVTAAIDVLASTRQFDTSQPGAPAPLGRSTNFPRSVAAGHGADPLERFSRSWVGSRASTSSTSSPLRSHGATRRSPS